MATVDGVTHRLTWADRNAGWRMKCSCGWLDAKLRWTENNAVLEGNRHVRQARRRPVSPSNHALVRPKKGRAYKSLTSQLALGLAPHETDYQEIQLGTLRPTGTQLTNPEPEVARLGAELASLVGEIGRQLDRYSSERAAGIRVDAASEFPADVVRVYSSMIALANELRTTQVPEEWRPVYSALLECTRQPLRQIRDFATHLNDGVLTDLNIEIETSAIQSLVTSISNATRPARIQQELDDLKREATPRPPGVSHSGASHSGWPQGAASAWPRRPPAT